MNKIKLSILLFCMLCILPSVQAQDFYGASSTGKYTVGVNLKYDGNLWAGVNFNLRNFRNFGQLPVDYNTTAAVKIDQGVSSINWNLGVGHLWADDQLVNNDFGFGARYGLNLDHCLGQTDPNVPNTTIGLELSFKPGIFNFQEAINANINITPLEYSSHCGGESGFTPKLEFSVLNNLEIGAHYDWANTSFGSAGNYHFSGDVNYDISTPFDTEPACDPEGGLSIQMSHSLRF